MLCVAVYSIAKPNKLLKYSKCALLQSAISINVSSTLVFNNDKTSVLVMDETIAVAFKNQLLSSKHYLVIVSRNDTATHNIHTHNLMTIL